MGEGCWTGTPLDKVVLLIIDGARFDFASPTSSVESDGANANVAKLHSIGEILERDDPSTRELFRFVADPPTTTQQRLKGILTGGLPTFVDVSKSFGGADLTEDNVIAQSAAAGRRVALSGDDTWLELFHESHFAGGVEPFPSFNVKDLDTVDNGVRRHLAAKLTQPERWDVLIGHFLGVDHAGHTFGVESAGMRRKIKENDADVKAVVAAMASDDAFDRALLIVMGDHGMTMHGDHGGARRRKRTRSSSRTIREPPPPRRTDRAETRGEKIARRTFSRSRRCLRSISPPRCPCFSGYRFPSGTWAPSPGGSGTWHTPGNAPTE